MATLLTADTLEAVVVLVLLLLLLLLGPVFALPELPPDRVLFDTLLGFALLPALLLLLLLLLLAADA